MSASIQMPVIPAMQRSFVKRRLKRIVKTIEIEAEPPTVRLANVLSETLIKPIGLLGH